MVSNIKIAVVQPGVEYVYTIIKPYLLPVFASYRYAQKP